ncbi:hypothetical protein PR048_017868 [Dryococelus australis]|uniref:Uncharacterized protein n=1 Tax=Dryococelus australis TaxID=614101 RepID=A0ABQ9HAP0_9NEOP|nr:hypothetical protein PR048_017868 [Dryococelus australis]
MMVKRGEYGAALERHGRGKGRSRENPPIRGIVRHDSHISHYFSSSSCLQKERSPPTKANRIRFPMVSLSDFRTRESCQTMPWSAGFLGGLPYHPPSHSGATPCSPRLTLIDSHDTDGVNIPTSLPIGVLQVIYLHRGKAASYIAQLACSRKFFVPQRRRENSRNDYIPSRSIFHGQERHESRQSCSGTRPTQWIIAAAASLSEVPQKVDASTRSASGWLAAGLTAISLSTSQRMGCRASKGGGRANNRKGLSSSPFYRIILLSFLPRLPLPVRRLRSWPLRKRRPMSVKTWCGVSKFDNASDVVMDERTTLYHETQPAHRCVDSCDDVLRRYRSRIPFISPGINESSGIRSCDRGGHGTGPTAPKPVFTDMDLLKNDRCNVFHSHTYSNSPGSSHVLQNVDTRSRHLPLPTVDHAARSESHQSSIKPLHSELPVQRHAYGQMTHLPPWQTELFLFGAAGSGIGGGNVYEDSVDDNYHDDSVEEVFDEKDDDSPDVPTHFSNKFPATDGVNMAEGVENANYNFPEDPN